MAKNNVKAIPQFTQEEIERFWSHVDAEDYSPGGCWEWTGRPEKSGYGAFRLRNLNYRPNRVAYFLSTGDDPLERLACHRCDNRKCVNPAHIWLGTCADNHADRDRKGRLARGERQHLAKLTAESVIEARRMCAAGAQAGSIARALGVHKTTIRCAVKRITWKHIK